MAKTTVEIVVKREQFDKLQQDVNQLNNTKINIQTKEFQREMSEAARATGQAADNLKKFVQVQDGTGQVVKEIQEYNDGLRTTVQYTDKLNKKTGDLELAQKKITTTFKDTTKAETEADKAGQEHNKTVEKQGLLYDILGRSVSSFLTRMAAYRAVYAGIRAITNGFKEALDTLKAVDDELVTVRKVTGFDAAQMAGVESQAYAVASKYGASAADYTSSVAAFARAGYKEVSTDLAELAEKTKIVGDTTADVAQQFLLSVDAAYQYRGNIEKLSAVLDGANEIDNKFATSIEKIAEGMGIVAPVAAQMNVSVDELAAGIGTITAVTQRSGTEAARALRAIFLNIVGDTKTEIDEGVTWTTGEIAGLRDVIKLYAKDAYDAAQASGEVIDPMRAIAGLAQSVKDGVLSEAKLTEMVSDIGGKLRTSQLLAIVNNWDMYENMLQTYRNAYGSADKEIENAMDSWTRKTNVLKNTWTEFVKTGLNSNAIKGALDILTGFIQRLDSLPAVLTRITMLVVGLRATKIVDGLQKAKDKVVDLFAAVKNGALTAQSAAGIVGIALAAIAAIWSGISKLVQDAKIRQKEINEAAFQDAEKAKKSSENILALYADFNTAAEGSDTLTESAKRLAEALGKDIPEGAEAAGESLRQFTREQLTKNLADLYKAISAAEKEFLSAAGEVAPAGGGNFVFGTEAPNREIADMWSGIAGRFFSNENSGAYSNIYQFLPESVDELKEFRAALQEVADETERIAQQTDTPALLDSMYYKDAIRYLNATAEAFEKLNETAADYDTAELQLRFLDLSSTIRVDSVEAYQKLIDTINLKNRGSDEEREALIALAEQYYPQFAQALRDSTDAVEGNADSVAGQTDELYANQKALDANATAEERLAAAKKDAEAAARKLIPALWDENGALSAAGVFALEADKNLAGMVQSELEAQLAAKKANYSALVAQLAVVGITAAQAAQQIWQISRALAGDTPGLSGAFMGAFMAAGGGSSVEALLAAKRAEIQRLMSQLGSITAYSGGGSSGGSSGGGGGSGHSGSGHSGSGHSGGGSSSSSNEDKKLTALQDRVKLLKSELSLMQERGDSEEDQIAKMQEIMSALEAERAYLASIKGDQATINGLAQEWWSYHNKIEEMMAKEAEDAERQAQALQDALDAQRALNNALNNRSVQYYNASTGQWEWIANQGDVESAQEKLRDAIENIPEDQRSPFLYSLYHSPGGGPLGITIPDFLPGEIADLLAEGGAHNRGGVNNYGNTYNFGGLNFNWQQARGLTLEQFAQLAGGLSIYNNSP